MFPQRFSYATPFTLNNACYFHHRFGTIGRKCHQLCSWGPAQSHSTNADRSRIWPIVHSQVPVQMPLQSSSTDNSTFSVSDSALTGPPQAFHGNALCFPQVLKIQSTPTPVGCARQHYRNVPPLSSAEPVTVLSATNDPEAEVPFPSAQSVLVLRNQAPGHLIQYFVTAVQPFTHCDFRSDESGRQSTSVMVEMVDTCLESADLTQAFHQV